MTYAIRYLPTDPFGRAGAVCGHFATRDEAENVARAVPNAAHVEVIER